MFLRFRDKDYSDTKSEGSGVKHPARSSCRITVTVTGANIFVQDTGTPSILDTFYSEPPDPDTEAHQGTRRNPAALVIMIAVPFHTSLALLVLHMSNYITSAAVFMVVEEV